MSDRTQRRADIKIRLTSTVGFFLGSVTLLLMGLFGSADAGQTPKATDGAAIWKKSCAPCHGAKGQGGAGYSKALTGKRTVAELTNFISKSMPPGKPCAAPEAKKVAAFMFDSFYSPIAQERNRPARVELSRLTVTQYKNAVADLVGPYYAVAPHTDKHGLKGEYFKGRDANDASRVIDRIDPEVKFDFGTQGPIPDKFDAHNFRVIWQGSVFAPDTGDYEFIVQSDRAVQLWINNQPKPLVDGAVRAVTDKEFRGSIKLLGGRAYRVRLEFSKATGGVNDDEKQKGKPAGPASVALLWRRPKLAEEVIPTRFLYPEWMPTTFVVTTPFPPDDRSIGYERGNSVSKEWDDATTSAALETADYIDDHLAEVSGVPEEDKDRKTKLQEFCRRFVERAFRRPISNEIAQTYVDKQFAAVPDLNTAVKRSVILTLLSPRFLYREAGKPDGYRVASDLSFGLWDSIPSPDLIQAAAKGELNTREQIAAKAGQMANDPRAWNKLRNFLLLWLKVDDTPDLVKNPKRFPGFDDAAATDLRSSLEIFLESTAWSRDADYRQLMLSPTEFLNGRLAKIYGINLPPDAPFQPVAMDAKERSGILTQPYLLARFAYVDNSSPIHRGVLIIRSLLGRTLQPPPAAFAPLAASLHPNLTTRERVSLQTSPAFCAKCHGMINPVGFTLERFDAIGRLRDKENGKPIDDTGSYKSLTGETVKFQGPTDLAKYLATSDEAKGAFVEKLFQNLVKQPALAYGTKTLPSLELSFAKNQYSIRSLMAEILVATTALDKDAK